MIETILTVLGCAYLTGALYYALDFLAFQRRSGQLPLWPVAIGIAIAWPAIAWAEWTGRSSGGD